MLLERASPIRVRTPSRGAASLRAAPATKSPREDAGVGRCVDSFQRPDLRRVQWRHFPAHTCRRTHRGRRRRPARALSPPGSRRRRSRQAEHDDALEALAGAAGDRRAIRSAVGAVRRPGCRRRRVPPGSASRARRRAPDRHQWSDPPPGFKIEFDLGSIQRFSPPGTVRLVIVMATSIDRPAWHRASSGRRRSSATSRRRRCRCSSGSSGRFCPMGRRRSSLASERDPLQRRARG